MDQRRLDFPPYSLWETRRGAGSPVALLHGLSGSSRWWGRNFDALAEEHLVAAVDLVGFGRNRSFFGLPRVPPLADVTALLARWLETFGEPVHLVGHSMGGLLAIAVAAERPDLVRSLLLVGAAGMPFLLDPRPHLRSLPRPPYGGPGIARVLVPDFIRAGPASVAVAGTRLLRADLREMMHALRVPALLVWGENDPLVPLVYGEAMQREIPGSELVTIPAAAHVPMWERPEAFHRIALQFLRRVDATPAVSPEARRFNWGISGWWEGIASRGSGPHRDIVLLHGLGMSSLYFGALARELFQRGWSPAAPDLPGFGESANAPAYAPAESAEIVARWADAEGIREAVWLGHSIGCNLVEDLARLRPDLVRGAVLVGPLWTASRWPSVRLFSRLALDALFEPLRLYRFVLPAYWRTGIARWAATWFRSVGETARIPELDASEDGFTALILAGSRDPIPDRRVMRDLIEVPGAHACLLSHAGPVAEAITARFRG